MNVEFVYNTDFRINNEAKITSWINSFCQKEGFTIDSLVFAFFNDEDLKSLNIKFLNHDYYTDVISFDESNKTLLKEILQFQLTGLKIIPILFLHCLMMS